MEVQVARDKDRKIQAERPPLQVHEIERPAHLFPVCGRDRVGYGFGFGVHFTSIRDEGDISNDLASV